MSPWDLLVLLAGVLAAFTRDPQSGPDTLEALPEPRKITPFNRRPPEEILLELAQLGPEREADVWDRPRLAITGLYPSDDPTHRYANEAFIQQAIWRQERAERAQAARREQQAYFAQLERRPWADDTGSFAAIVASGAA